MAWQLEGEVEDVLRALALIMTAVYNNKSHNSTSGITNATTGKDAVALNESLESPTSASSEGEDVLAPVDEGASEKKAASATSTTTTPTLDTANTTG